MRKRSSIAWLLASDAACIIGGFIAGAVVLHLLQASYTGAGSSSSQDFQVQRESGATVNRARKGDRLDRTQFGDRFGDMFWAGEPTVAPDDPSGRVLFWLTPGANTMIVPKDSIWSDQRRQPSPGPAPESRDRRKEQLTPTKTVGCEPVASSLVDPDLARFVGRCLARLRSLGAGASV